MMYLCTCGCNAHISITPSKIKCPSSKRALWILQTHEPESNWDFVKYDNLWHIEKTK